MNRIVSFSLVVAIFGLLCVGTAFGQGGTGELTGLVTDPTGAVVSGATVTLTNGATGEKREAGTTSAGIYRFGALPVVGTYSIEIKAQRFRTYKLANVIVSVGAVTNHDVKLEVGSASETVSVEAGAQLIQPTESSLSDLLNQHVWQSMPLETRSQNEFVALLPGAEPQALQGTGAMGTDRGASVNGARSGTGNFLVDGFANNDQGLGGGGSSVGPGGANTTISPDAIQEYRVIEHIPTAEYGGAGGFTTDTVLKSGTNQWHGSIFEYNRIQALAANSFFSGRANQQDHLVRNQFGGSVGGPIVKDKSFFFFTVESHRLRTGTPLTANTMTSDFVNFVNTGAFETFQESDPAGFCNIYFGASCPGSFAADATLGTTFATLQAKQNMPLCVSGAANCSATTNLGQGLYTGANFIPNPIVYPVPVYGQVTVAAPAQTNQMRYTTKFDQRLSSKDQLSASFVYDNADSQTAYGGGDNTLGPTLFNHTRAQNVGVTWSHTFNPNLLNQARVAYTRHTGNFPDDPNLVGYPSIYTAFDSAVMSYGSASNLPQFFTENAFIYKDDISITRGKHNFKTGVEYERTRNGSSFDALKNGLFAPNDVEDLVTDLTFSDIGDSLLFGGPAYGSAAYAEASINPNTGGLPVYYRGFRANSYAAYAQDDWRATSRLTLNLGVRWEYFGPPHNFQPNIDANFYPGSTSPVANPGTNPFWPGNNPFYASITNGSEQLRNHDIWNKDTNNFGPRVGFAFDALGNQKFVVRGGYGINYDRMYNNIFENIRFNPPNFAFALVGAFGNGVPIGGIETPGVYTVPFTSTAAFGGAGLTPSIRDMNPKLATAYYEQANLGFQYELSKGLVWETNYVGTFGHKLLGIIGANTYDGRYSAGVTHDRVNAAYSNVSFRTNCCDSNYHALQTTLKKSFANGLQFNANYTYAKALDDISDTFTTKNASGAAYPTDSMNVKFDYGLADFDVRHRVVGGFVYDLPLAKGNRWLGGWGVSGIISAQTGSPFSVTDSATAADSNKDNQHNDRASYIGTGTIKNAVHHSASPADGYLSAADFAMPGTASLPCPATVNLGLWCEGAVVGQMRRNSLIGPGYFNTDIGISKAFKFTETMKLTFFGNFFNLLNHPNFLLPDNNLNSGTFGQSTSTFTTTQTGGPRNVQLALRFDF